jgi:1,4-dihydroxy-2-naphthoate octaprenyltransferase
MRLRTLPLSLAGVVCGGIMGYAQPACRPGTHVFLILTAVFLQILSNLSNEMGDYRSGVDNAERQGPSYGMANGLTEKQLWWAINTMVILCSLSGLIMLILSFPLSSFQFPLMVLVGAAAIWAATHYTLGKKPYGYLGLGDLFVFIFFGLVSVLGSHYVIAHNLYVTDPICTFAPAVGLGLLSVAVLNVNNIRDMASDEGLRKTIPLRIGKRGAKIYQTLLVVLGVACFAWNPQDYWMCVFPTSPFFLWHIIGVWRREGKRLDPMLPLLVITTFVLASLYGDVFNVTYTCPYPIW